MSDNRSLIKNEGRKVIGFKLMTMGDSHIS